MAKGHVTDQKGSLDPVCVSGKKNYKLFPITGRDGAVSTPASTVLNTGMGPGLIHEKGVNPVWHSYVRSVHRPRLLDAFKEVTKSWDLIYLTVRITEF